MIKAANYQTEALCQTWLRKQSERRKESISFSSSSSSSSPFSRDRVPSPATFFITTSAPRLSPPLEAAVEPVPPHLQHQQQQHNHQQLQLRQTLQVAPSLGLPEEHGITEAALRAQITESAFRAKLQAMLQAHSHLTRLPATSEGQDELKILVLAEIRRQQLQ
jgi:hypothetical protein